MHFEGLRHPNRLSKLADETPLKDDVEEIYDPEATVEFDAITFMAEEFAVEALGVEVSHRANRVDFPVEPWTLF